MKLKINKRSSNHTDIIIMLFLLFNWHHCMHWEDQLLTSYMYIIYAILIHTATNEPNEIFGCYFFCHRIEFFHKEYVVSLLYSVQFKILSVVFKIHNYRNSKQIIELLLLMGIYLYVLILMPMKYSMSK